MSHPSGAQLIAAERQRQIDSKGYSAELDDRLRHHELVEAAIAYAATGMGCEQAALGWWPEHWDTASFKPRHSIADLIRAGALIAAEIDRLQRLAQEPPA